MGFLLFGKQKPKPEHGDKMKNKKAQFFTLIAIFLIILMFLSFEMYSLLNKDDSAKTRVLSMGNFLLSVEENLERQTYISGFRIIFLAEDQIATSGNYVSNFNSFFNEAFFNGTINGEPENSIMPGATYNDIVDSINNKAKKINVNITLTNPNITITQNDPWNVEVNLTLEIIMKDKANLASWEKTENISTKIPVTFFEDPIYVVNSSAKISRKINQTSYEGNYVNGEDFSNLIDHLNRGYYAANPDAPSFLNRLQGDLSSDENGIESFVYIPDFSAQGIPILDKTIIDYLYFSSQNPPYHAVEGMPSWFKIDYAHDEKYGLT